MRRPVGCVHVSSVVREVEMARIWSGSIIVNIFFFHNHEDVPCFSDVDFFPLCTGYAISDTGGDALKSIIIDVAGSFRFECRVERLLFEDFYGFLYLCFLCDQGRPRNPTTWPRKFV